MTALSVTAPHQLHAPHAVGDWGPDIFKEINQSLQESRSMNVPSSSNRYNHHTSTLSDASSIYNAADNGHRGSSRQISIDSKLQPQHAGGPKIILQSSDSTREGEGGNRRSDASFLEPTSSDQSNGGSSRNTKELGDFYDSYGRPSGQGQAYGQQGNQTMRSTELARDGRKPGQMELKPETITEVPSPLQSPSIGKAM